MAVILDGTWFRQTMFGAEPTALEGRLDLPLALSRISAEIADLARVRFAGVADSNPLAATLSAQSEPIREALSWIPSLAGLEDEPSMMVALMGRTTAGKSTLLEALTHGDGTRQGRGGQRTTRSVHSQVAVEIPRVILIDTPGVGARDGLEDWAAAFAQVPEADLILWVAANDNHQEETTRALRLLAVQGKPIVVALNCRYRIDDLDGRLTKDCDLFLRDPSLAFDEAADHAEILSRHLAAAGLPQVEVLPIHARAAFLSTTSRERAAELREASGIDDVIGLLTAKRDSVLRSQLRALREVDRIREPLTKARIELKRAIEMGELIVLRERARTDDAEKRMRRSVDRVKEQLLNEIVIPIDARRRWHLGAEPGKEVTQSWEAEAQALGDC